MKWVNLVAYGYSGFVYLLVVGFGIWAWWDETHEDHKMEE
jgi:hypothetical protein